MYSADRKLKVFNASAGSGKTFTLAKEFIKIVVACPYKEEFDSEEASMFTPDYFRRILAITFTNEASKEIRERIIESLSEIADFRHEGTLSPMMEDLKKELLSEYSLDLTYIEISRRCFLIHKSILLNFSALSISTIDSFNQRIVRSFSRELNLPSEFEVLIEKDEFLKEVLGKLYEKIGSSGIEALTSAIVQMTENLLEEGKKWDIDYTLLSFAREVTQPDVYPLFSLLDAISVEELQEWKTVGYERLNEWFETIKTILEPIRVLVENASPVINKKSTGKFLKDPTIENILEWYLASMNYSTEEGAENLITAKYKTKAEGIQLQELIVDVFTRFKEECEQGDKLFVARRFDSTFSHMEILISLKYMIELIHETSKEQRIVMIDQYNMLINSIVERDPIPFIYERVGDKFMHILIDEFQDTSELQWHNLVPMVSNALSFGMTALIVGDPKQSIYGFRGGKPDLLVDLPNVKNIAENSVIHEHLYNFKNSFNPVPLTTNWRSKRNIISFNNDFFTFITKEYSTQIFRLEDFYKDTVQLHTHKEGGRVCIRNYPHTKEQYLEQLPQLLVEFINSKIKEGYTYKDICFLARSNEHGSLIASSLQTQRIPVLSKESMSIASSASVQCLLNFLKVLNSPDQYQSKFECIHILLKKKSAPTSEISTDLLISAREVSNKTGIRSFLSYLKEDLGFKKLPLFFGKFSVYETLEEAIRGLEWHLENDEQIFIHRLLDAVFEAQSVKVESLADFIEYIDKKIANMYVSSSFESNAVRVMTIHKSKGLEFPVVCMPFLTKSLKKGISGRYWQEDSLAPFAPDMPISMVKHSLLKEENNEELQLKYLENERKMPLEEINSLYVALTRASEQLYLFLQQATPPKSDNNKETSLNTIKYSSLVTQYLASKDIQIDPNEFIEIDLFPIDENQNRKFKVDSETETYHLRIPSGQYADKVRLRKASGSFDDSFSKSKVYVDPTAHGTVIHELLSKIIYVEDLEKVLSRKVRAAQLTETEATKYRKILSNILQHPELGKYFLPMDGRWVRTEMEILDTSTSTLKRVDRVIFDSEGATIIEFKSGVQSDSDIPQIQVYESLLLAAGYPIRAKILFYIENFSLIFA